VKLLEPAPVAAVRPIWTEPRDLLKQKPVGDELFRTYRSLYSYDQTSLDATVESVDRTNPHWVVERISMDAAYGGERLIAYLYLPKRGKPPFQTVVYFPGSGAIRSQRVGDSPGSSVEFIIRGGRALLFPVYKSTFERQDGLLDTTQSPTAHYRDHLVAWYRDMARAVDYAVTRKDVEATRLAYYGLSWGGRLGAPMVALEPRFKAAVFASGGLNFQHVFPEADPLNFAPRVTIPVLMINGSYDHVFPLETSATPLFRALGTPAAHKRHAIFPTGHAPPRAETIRETLDWLDRYLGPV